MVTFLAVGGGDMSWWELIKDRVAEGIGLRRRGCVPGLEGLAVRVVLDVADHEVGEVAEFVGEDVEEAVLRIERSVWPLEEGSKWSERSMLTFIVDYFLCELDGGMVMVDC